MGQQTAYKKGDFNLLLALLRDRARRVANDLHADFTEHQQGGLTFDQALNSVAVLGYHATECHCLSVLAQNMADATADGSGYVKDPSVRAALLRVFELSILQQIREKGGDFGAVLDSSQLRLVLRRVNELMDEIRPDVVALVDGFAMKDTALHSTLGRYDGNVYEAIYNEAKLNPLNKGKMVGWEHVAPMLDLEFMRSNMSTQRHGSKL